MSRQETHREYLNFTLILSNLIRWCHWHHMIWTNKVEKGRCSHRFLCKFPKIRNYKSYKKKYWGASPHCSKNINRFRDIWMDCWALFNLNSGTWTKQEILNFKSIGYLKHKPKNRIWTIHYLFIIIIIIERSSPTITP